MRGQYTQFVANEGRALVTGQLYRVCLPVKLDGGEAGVVGYAVHPRHRGDLHTADTGTDWWGQQEEERRLFVAS